jgi:hypothetical protein
VQSAVHQFQQPVATRCQVGVVRDHQKRGAVCSLRSSANTSALEAWSRLGFYAQTGENFRIPLLGWKVCMMAIMR